MTREIQEFENSELGCKVRCIKNEDGSISMNAEDTAIGFGWARAEERNGKKYVSVRWSTINGYCKDLGFANLLAKDDFIPESLFYLLGMKASNDDFLNDLLDETNSHLTEDELRREKWMHQFDYEIRKFPITDSLRDFIQHQLDKLHYSPEEFVDIINENRGLEGIEIQETNKLNIEIIDTGNNSYYVLTSIRFDFPKDYIKKILLKEISVINYINMQGIIFNLFLSDNNTIDDAHKKTDQLLYDNQFYTIKQRNQLINEKLKEKRKNNESFTFYDIQPTDYDKQYIKIKNDINNGFDFIRDKNIIYACERLESLSANMHNDLGLIIAIMSAPIHKIDSNLNQDFWEDYQKLVTSYIERKSINKNN